MTVSFASTLASWMPMEPTPPAPPMMSTDLPSCSPFSETPRRSNSASHAVMAVSGSAAACAKSSDAGLCPAIDHTIDHRGDIPAQLRTLGFENVDYILCFNDTDRHFKAMAEAIAPQGKICSIVENSGPLAVGDLKSKSATFVWEFMFTRAMYGTPDMVAQHKLLNEVARLIDAGRLQTTLGENLGAINAENLRRAHAMLEGGQTIGKLVLQGF